jgi:hypothetical protein
MGPPEDERDPHCRLSPGRAWGRARSDGGWRASVGNHPGGASRPRASSASTSTSTTSHRFAALVMATSACLDARRHSARPPSSRWRPASSTYGKTSASTADGSPSVGTSVGAERALAMASYIEGLGLAAVVAVAPSSVVWQALADSRPRDKPRWTLGRGPLNYAPARARAAALADHDANPLRRAVRRLTELRTRGSMAAPTAGALLSSLGAGGAQGASGSGG